MGVLSVGNGSQQAVINTEHAIITQTGVGVYVFVCDCGNMVAGDVLLIRIKSKYYTGGTVHSVYTTTLNDLQTNPNVYSIPIPIDTEIDVTIQQTNGVGRIFPWNLLRM